MTTSPTIALLLRARQNRQRNAEAARQAELRARAARTPQVRSDWAEIATEYRSIATAWGDTVEEIESTDPALRRRQCADSSGCPKRAGDGSPFCAEHDEGA
jgi:hypothetical protein